jgi:hypothetical protein
MKKLLLLISCIFLLSSPVWSSVENFTSGWSETDPGGKLTQTSTRASWTGLAQNTGDTFLEKTGTYVYSGNLNIIYDGFVNSSSGADYVPGSISISGETDSIYLNFGESGSGKVYVSIESDTGDPDDDSTTLLLNTVYYFRLKRIGLNITLDVYGSSANRITETSKLLTLSTTQTVAEDIDGVIVSFMWNDTSSVAHTGYIENLDLGTRRVMVIN